jgi:SAM-dependent methyltransferase
MQLLHLNICVKILLPSVLKRAVTHIYKNFIWSRANTSGVGSMPWNARPYLKMLQRLFNETRYTTVVDYGCGNWELMKHIAIPPEVKYLGIDLVKQVIDRNIHLYERSNIHSREIYRQEDAMHIRADVLIIKDVMQHWPNEEIFSFLRNILPNYRMAILTNDFCKCRGPPPDIRAGGGHCFDLRKQPFELMAELILDWQCARTRKHVLLWRRDSSDSLATIRGYTE